MGVGIRRWSRGLKKREWEVEVANEWNQKEIAGLERDMGRGSDGRGAKLEAEPETGQPRESQRERRKKGKDLWWEQWKVEETG
jgi:hypothetical protein